MPKYLYTGSDAKHIPSLGITVEPEQEIETEQEINHPEFEKIISASQEKRVIEQRRSKKMFKR